MKEVKTQKEGGSEQDFIYFYLQEHRERFEMMAKKKKSYIDWVVKLNPRNSTYQSNSVTIDEHHWKFIASVDSTTNTFNIYIQMINRSPSGAPAKKVVRSSPSSQRGSFSSKIIKLNSIQSSLPRKATPQMEKFNQQSLMHSINRIAGKQRQPNQNQGQKNHLPQSQKFIQKSGGKRQALSLSNSQVRIDEETNSKGCEPQNSSKFC